MLTHHRYYQLLILSAILSMLMQRYGSGPKARERGMERKAPAAKREVDQDMVAREKSNRFDIAYDAFRDVANDRDHIDLRRYSTGITSEDEAGVLSRDGQEKLQELVHLPRTWPLARLTIPLQGLSKQIDRLLEGYCFFQILATNRYPEAHNGRVLQTATHLTWILAEYLADTIARVDPPQGLSRHLLEHILGTQGAAGSSEPIEDTDSTEVKYKIRQWSLPGAAVVPVLNVSSRVFWLELDDKALLDSYGVLQEGILCDVFSQKSSAAWQGARGERQTVSVMLPDRQNADDWLNFMLSQKNLWPTFTTRSTLTEEISAQVFSKVRR
eukprot:symbB.v1.2.041958.t1/scaffold8927.1/size4644/1